MKKEQLVHSGTQCLMLHMDYLKLSLVLPVVYVLL